MAHILYTQGLFLCMSQVRRMLLCLSLHLPVCQEQCRTVPLPYNKYIHQQLLLSHKSLPGLHKELRWTAESMVLWSMQGNMHPHLLL